LSLRHLQSSAAALTQASVACLRKPFPYFLGSVAKQVALGRLRDPETGVLCSFASRLQARAEGLAWTDIAVSGERLTSFEAKAASAAEKIRAGFVSGH